MHPKHSMWKHKWSNFTHITEWKRNVPTHTSKRLNNCCVCVRFITRGPSSHVSPLFETRNVHREDKWFERRVRSTMHAVYVKLDQLSLRGGGSWWWVSNTSYLLFRHLFRHKFPSDITAIHTLIFVWELVTPKQLCVTSVTLMWHQGVNDLQRLKGLPGSQ